MRRATAIAAALMAGAAAVGCVEQFDPPQALSKPRILHVHTEPPALTPPGEATASVVAYHPDYRVPTVHWYVAATIGLDQLEDAFVGSLSDPTAVTAGSGLIYVGAGTQVSLSIPPLDRGEVPPEALFDVLPLPLVVSVSYGALELKAVKQLRLVLPNLVARRLSDELGRAPTAAELNRAVAARRNRNPRIRGLALARVPVDDVYDLDGITDLKVRRAYVTAPVTAAVGVGAEQGLRVTAAIDDPDLALGLELGEPGFNKLTATLYRPAGETYPLSLTHFDWIPADVEQATIFDDPRLRWVQPPLTPLYYALIDRQGGTDLAAVEVDVGAPPRPEHRGPGGSVLLAEGVRMIWLRLPDAASMPSAPLGTPLAVTASVRAARVPPHGVVATLLATGPVTGPPTRVLDALLHRPDWRGALADDELVLHGRLVRRWRP